MDRYQGRAWLGWWANRSTCLGSVEIDLDVRCEDDHWRTRGRLLTSDPEQVEAFQFLCQLDPLFRLHFGGAESTFDDPDSIDVLVEPDDNPQNFTITRYDGPPVRKVSFTFDL
ncbi:MAG TPA: hypothetical protein VKB69_12375 [Micromonosporaceae bacterium]|nr:hypothetical protein [Micromonosporaceae bacterium]